MTIPSSFSISLSLCKDRPTTAERGKTSLPPYGGSSHLSSLCLVPPSLPPIPLSLSLPCPSLETAASQRGAKGRDEEGEREPLAALRFPRQKKGSEIGFFSYARSTSAFPLSPVCPSSTVQNRQLSVSPLPPRRAFSQVSAVCAGRVRTPG